MLLKHHKYPIPTGDGHHLLFYLMTVLITIHCTFPKKYIDVLGETQADQHTHVPLDMSRRNSKAVRHPLLSQENEVS